MNMKDETLSAFLDNELTDAEMEAVRDQLEQDPTLSDRLAEIASVDAELQAHYGSIDDRPMPAAITRMLEESASRSAAPAQDNVVTFPWWRRLPGHTGKAIAAAVIAGVALTQWLVVATDGDPMSPAVANFLDSQPSGEVYEVDDHTSMTPRLTFQGQDGQWCRQFRMETQGTASEQIACRTGAGSWALVASAKTEPSLAPDVYQTASGGSALDQELDQMMTSPPIGPNEERMLLKQKWRSD